MTENPINVEFILDGKIHAVRSRIPFAPMIGDVICLNRGYYKVISRTLDFSEGLRSPMIRCGVVDDD